MQYSIDSEHGRVFTALRLRKQLLANERTVGATGDDVSKSATPVNPEGPACSIFGQVNFPGIKVFWTSLGRLLEVFGCLSVLLSSRLGNSIPRIASDLILHPQNELPLMPRRHVVLGTFAILVAVAITPWANAQDSGVSASDYASSTSSVNVGANQNRRYAPAQAGVAEPLTGDVQHDVMRIRRSSNQTNQVARPLQQQRLTGTIEKNRVTIPKVPTLVESADYATSIAPPPPPPPPPKKAKGNYIWGQSAMGGYYDGTGQIKVVVPGDELYKYGGKFMDGVEVPDYPVTVNFRQHTYRPFIMKRSAMPRSN